MIKPMRGTTNSSLRLGMTPRDEHAWSNEILAAAQDDNCDELTGIIRLVDA